MRMLDTSFIGKEYPPFSVEVEKGHIRRFAHAIGDESPVWRDPDAAKSLGYQAIPAPPTFAFTLLMEANQSFLILDEMGIDKRKSMHAEQGFVYHAPILAGDTITGRQKILDMYEKKGGALQFIVTETRMTNQKNQPVCDLRTVIVVRNG
jgi:acyl dehydratase